MSAVTVAVTFAVITAVTVVIIAMTVAGIVTVSVANAGCGPCRSRGARRRAVGGLRRRRGRGSRFFGVYS